MPSRPNRTRRSKVGKVHLCRYMKGDSIFVEWDDKELDITLLSVEEAADLARVLIELTDIVREKA